MGTVHFFLEIEIIRKRGSHQIALNQSAYIQKILQPFHLADAHTVSTPLNSGSQLRETPDPADEEVDETEYRSMIGSLMYLMLCNRPDIVFAVGTLSGYDATTRRARVIGVPQSTYCAMLKKLHTWNSPSVLSQPKTCT